MASDSSDYPDAPERSDSYAPDAGKAKPEKENASYEDVLEAPPNRVAEVLGGSLYTFPRPAMPHARASSGVLTKLGDPFDYGNGPGGWWIVYEPELHLGEDIVVPDVAGWRRERMQAIPDAAYVTQAPDWACEVLSPSTRAIDQGEKMTIYAREGVAHLWLVDPLSRWLAAYALRGGRYALLRKLTGNAPVSLPPFDAITFSLADLWLSPR